MTDLVTKLSTVAQRYADSRHLSLARVSALVFGNSRKLRDVVARRADLTTRSWERSVQWFSDHWPAAVEWPVDVPRPAPAITEAIGNNHSEHPASTPPEEAP